MAMPEIQLYDVRDVTAALLCQLGIREGTWKLCVEMGTAVTEVQTPGGELLPAVVASVQRVGVCRCAPEHPMAVEAAEVNPSMSMCVPDWDQELEDLEE